MKLALCLSALALFVCACGNSDAESAAATEESELASDQATDEEPVELTDGLMEEYLVIFKESNEAANLGSFAFLSRHGWTTERWLRVCSAVSLGMMSASRAQMGDAAATSMQQLDTQIAELEQKVKTAPEDQRGMLQQQLDMYRQSRESLASMTAPVSDLDRRNAETLKRWMPRLEEAGKGN